MSHSWLKQVGDDAVVLTLHVQPNARRTEFAGPHGEAMKLRLAAPPVDGKANAALCVYLAKFCGVPRAAVSLVGGENSRAKKVRIDGMEAAALLRLRGLG